MIYTQTPTVQTTLPQMQQIQQPQQGGGKKGKKRQHKENAILADSVDDLPCAPDDEDLNTPYQCDTCNKTIKGRVMLQAHQYQEHYENPNMGQIGEIGDKHACRVCLKLFTRNSDVKAHILRVHCGDRRYPCTMCGKRFKESTHLRKHLYTHTGKEANSFLDLVNLVFIMKSTHFLFVLILQVNVHISANYAEKASRQALISSVTSEPESIKKR